MSVSSMVAVIRNDARRTEADLRVLGFTEAADATADVSEKLGAWLELYENEIGPSIDSLSPMWRVVDRKPRDAKAIAEAVEQWRKAR